MTGMSKPVCGFDSSLSCHEIGHTWDPSCTSTYIGLWKDVFPLAMKIYAAIFLVPAALRRKTLRHVLTHSVPQMLRSSAFLTTFASSFVSFVCVYRRILGALYVPSMGFLPGFTASLIALPIERKSRRGDLAVY
eukprot:Colp12_sorted_trinity150504_noHs@25148